MNMDASRREQRIRLLTASLRLALTNTLSTKVTRPHVNSIFDTASHEALREQEQSDAPETRPQTGQSTHDGRRDTWISRVRRYLTPIGPKTTEIPSAMPQNSTDASFLDNVGSQAEEMSTESSVGDSRHEELSPVDVSTIRPRRSRKARVDSALATQSSSTRLFFREENERRSQSPEARGTLSDSTTLVSLDLSPAIAQVVQPPYSAFTSPFTDTSSFPSAASPCVRISSSILHGTPSAGPSSPQIPEDDQEPPSDPCGTVLRRTRASRVRGDQARNASRPQSRHRLSLSRSESTDTRTENAQSLKTWLARVSVSGTLESSPPLQIAPPRISRRTSKRSSGPTVPSSPFAVLSAPSSPSQYTRETYPRTRVTPGRIFYKTPAPPSIDEQTRPKPGEFLTKPHPPRSGSFDSMLTGTPDMYTHELRSNTSRRLRELFVEDGRERDREATPERRVSETTKHEVEDMERRFAATMEMLGNVFTNADKAKKGRIADDVEYLLRAIGPRKSASRTQSQEQARGRSPRLKKKGSEVSIIKGKHGDENYFGQTVLSPAFI